ncbi:MAG: hypothetical protein JXR40_02795 [Pontiellaceae bacterium]|nr:hypothetical protein [Pontiellaceae bacterium]
MDWISSLEKRFGSWAIPHLGVYIILLQGIGFFLLAGEYATVSDLVLYGNDVIHAKEWWRLFSFLMMPADTSLFLLLAMYIFYLMSSALEQRWGSFRFNLFILVGYLFTVAAAFIKPDVQIVNTYFLGAVFLAFATLFPDFEFLLFFVLPVKVKWLGWITAAGFALTLFSGNNPGDRLCVLAAFLTYALFFGRDFLRGQATAKRRKAFVAENVKVESSARHTCTICGVTDQSDPTMGFRYCSTCGKCFCEEHIQQHQHE